MTRLTDEAQAALDAVRAALRRWQPAPGGEWPVTVQFERAVLAALENLNARLKALEGAVARKALEGK